jgi:sugar phosphate isomerase/epimerase
MINRKEFIRQVCLLSAGSLAAGPSIAGAFAKDHAIGLQLYTLRAEMAKDPVGTLKKVAALGFSEVENFGYNGKFFGMEPVEYRKTLNDLGLKAPSGHYLWGGASPTPPPGSIRANWKQSVEDAATIGQKYMVLAFLFPNERQSLDQYKKVTEDLNKAGEDCAKAGLQLAYHNHDFEFQALEGTLPFNILMSGTDSAAVKIELDLYWASKAGQPPVDLFRKYEKRVELWHVKDMDKTEKKFFTEVGNGVIDFNAIFKAHKQSGMKHFFVEQDQCPGNPLDSISQSIGYIKKNLLKLV